MFEYVKYNCHVMTKNDVGKTTPQKLLESYEKKRINGTDFVFDGIECVVTSIGYDSSKTSIITKILRKDDAEQQKNI